MMAGVVFFITSTVLQQGRTLWKTYYSGQRRCKMPVEKFKVNVSWRNLILLLCLCMWKLKHLSSWNSTLQGNVDIFVFVKRTIIHTLLKTWLNFVVNSAFFSLYSSFRDSLKDIKMSDMKINNIFHVQCFILYFIVT